ncbi:MAG TPA: Flp family type IVb pilin [Telluria sp.]|nr:Flp family type IVb pilin [Telluria sp.]
MNTVTSAVKTFVDDENGVTAIEYGLIAAMIAAALVIGVGFVTGALNNAFTYIQTSINNAVT